MIRCDTCSGYYPHKSDIAVCIREFGECVDCRIKKGEFYEDDLIWIKFVNAGERPSRDFEH